MILPKKHVRVKASLLGLGAAIIEELERPMTVNHLWNQYHQRHSSVPFVRFALVLSFLFTLGVIEEDQGLLQRQTR